MIPIETKKDFYTVSEISSAISLLFSENFSGAIKVKGEISGLNASSSAHWYFSIKDNEALLNGVCWKFRIPSLKFVPKNGDAVYCYGKLKTYAGRSSYQLDVERFEPFGQGDLALKLLELKEKFLKEGLFDEVHKKKLPYLPRTIGVVTSPTGAVIQDIIKTIEATFPSHIVIYPVPVQGNGAGEKIAEAINNFNKLPVDVIIVARGGGSLEDLWEFNLEPVVRATYNSRLPIVSGVGHETDTTLIDYASDLRALTPTKAAIAVVPNIIALKNNMHNLAIRLNNAMMKILNTHELKLKAQKLPDVLYTVNVKEQKLEDMASKLKMIIEKQLMMSANRLLNVENKLPVILKHRLEINFEKIKQFSNLLESYSYKNVLTRGFVMVKNKDNLPLTSAKNMKENDVVNLQFKDGEACACITDIKP